MGGLLGPCPKSQTAEEALSQRGGPHLAESRTMNQKTDRERIKKRIQISAEYIRGPKRKDIFLQ